MSVMIGRLFGIALFLVGFVPVLLFMLGVFPDFSWLSGIDAWLHKRRVPWAPSSGLLFALPGLAAMLLGAAIVRWQQPALDAMQARREDARRRRREYGPAERIEPTLRIDKLEAVD